MYLKRYIYGAEFPHFEKFHSKDTELKITSTSNLQYIEHKKVKMKMRRKEDQKIVFFG